MDRPRHAEFSVSSIETHAARAPARATCSKSREQITAQRMNEKLGWVREFRDDLASWIRCEEVMQTSLSFINHQGLSHGIAAALEETLKATHNGSAADCELSEILASKLIAFVHEAESQLSDGERAWLSTENIETLFGRYSNKKRL